MEEGLINYERNTVIRASEVFTEFSLSLQMDKMESVRVLNLNMEILPQAPRGL